MAASNIKGAANTNGDGALLQQLENYIIIDVGANLTNKKFSRDLDSVIQRARDAGKTLQVTYASIKLILFYQ